MAIKSNRVFKLPAQPSNRVWSLSPKEMLFLDMTIFFGHTHSELYRMAVKNDMTDTQCRTRASALVTSLDGQDYLRVRTAQLQEYYWPEAEKEAGKKRGRDGFSEDFVPNIIKKLETIINNPNDPNYFDAIKVGLTKAMKDIASDDLVRPPERYLPESCSSCRYKNFIEKQCVDECKICRYRQFSNDNGVEYTYQNQLDMSLAPEEETTTIEEEETVNTNEDGPDEDIFNDEEENSNQ